jgi:peptidoglycan/LPS O-acetylase OafA/YrhL
MTTIPLAGRQRFLELDGLRGIAALWVVIFHLTYATAHVWLRTRPGLAADIVVFDTDIDGFLGVDLFFIISGFVITMSLDRNPNLRDFAASRFARLFPAYWAAVAVSSAVGMLFPQPAVPVSLGQAAVNMTMLQAFVRVRPVDPSYWSLSVELGFYGLMALAILTGQRHRIERFGVLWVLAGVVGEHVLPAFGFDLPWRASIGLALPYAGLFYAGILFYGIRTEGFAWWRVGGILLCLASRAAFMPLTMMVIECAIFLVFALAVAGRLPVLRTPPLLALGAISYSLYVIHQPLAVRLQLAFHAIGLSPWANLAATLACVIAAAWLLAHWVEHPGAALLRRRFSASRTPAVVPAAQGIVGK